MRMGGWPEPNSLIIYQENWLAVATSMNVKFGKLTPAPFTAVNALIGKPLLSTTLL